MDTNELVTRFQSNTLTVIYDGECPFCSNFVAMAQIKQVIDSVRLVNAREIPDLVEQLRGTEYDLNDGMIVIYAGTLYYGGDAVNILSILSKNSSLTWSLIAGILKRRKLALCLYPVMKTGRRLTLNLMGRDKL